MPIALQDMWQHLQRQLFPILTDELGELGEKDHQFVQAVALLPLAPFLEPYRWKGNGRPPRERTWLVHAFVAKAVYQFVTTEGLVEALKARPTLRRLCGWESVDAVPSLSVFSRAFAQFAADELPQKIHEALVKLHCGPKLVGHISRDATSIVGHEEPPPEAPASEPPKPVARRKRGRPKKGQEPPPAPPTRLQLQPQRTLAQNLADLPKGCDSGAKQGSKGNMEYWWGYKLHLDVIDGDIPISVVLTSASTHDSQVAIPLTQMSAQRVQALYQLMDAAYDAAAIRQYVLAQGQVPIIEPKQRGNWIPLDPAQRRRFAQRSASERVNGRLKDFYGGRQVRVRGAAKVMCHLMFGILAITALSLWQRLG